jgi:ferredoxin
MEVSLDQALCRGDCICSEICPQVFVLDEEGIAYVVAGGAPVNPGGPDRWAPVPPGLEPAVQDAAGECPTGAILVRGDGGAQETGGQRG